MRYDVNSIDINNDKIRLSIKDLLYDITYTRTLDASQYDIEKILGCNKYHLAGSYLVLENKYYSINLSSSSNKAKYLVYTHENKEYTCDIINGEEFKELLRFASMLYYKRPQTEEKLKNKINFINVFKNDVDIGDTTFLVFLNLFLSYFSYNHNANIKFVTIDQTKERMYLMIEYITHETREIYSHYVMHCVFPGEILCMIPKMPYDKKKQSICMTPIFSNYGRHKIYWAMKKSRSIIDNYF